MNLKETIILRLDHLNLFQLSQVFNFTEQITNFFFNIPALDKSFQHPLLKYVGIINNDEARELKQCIADEFTQIEGVW